jgi:DNA-binding transcriptional ArsR family regulator
VENDPRIPLLKQLADPLRLRVIDRLGHVGPATPTRLAAEFGVPLPQLSNHLRRLREARLVTATRDGRQAVYALADPGLELLTPLLDSITGRLEADIGACGPTDVPSRTCYAHLGGRLGVAMFRGLVERDALRPQPDGMVALGPAAGQTLGSLGVDLEAVPDGRRRFAFECLDATERVPHLAGALADAIARAVIGRGWVSQEPESRVVSLTPAGRRELMRLLGVRLSAPAAGGAP